MQMQQKTQQSSRPGPQASWELNETTQKKQPQKVLQWSWVMGHERAQVDKRLMANHGGFCFLQASYPVARLEQNLITGKETL